MNDIPLDQLRARHDNANVMPGPLLRKLAAHIERTGRYPPVIVRPHPVEMGAYEILDGHHRVEALRRLRRTSARCDVWDVDDDEALILLTTLNRLQGTDDVVKRAELVQRLIDRLGREKIPSLLPEDEARIERLLEVRLPPPRPAAPPALDEMPEAVTFFLTGPQKRALDQRLAPLDGTRSQRLVALLGLEMKLQMNTDRRR